MVPLGGGSVPVRKPIPGKLLAHKTMCAKGVWCTGRIPTAVLAHKLHVGEKPACLVCGSRYHLPPSSPYFKSVGGGVQGVSGSNANLSMPAGSRGSGKILPLPSKAQIETEKQLEACKNRFKQHNLEIPQPESNNKYYTLTAKGP